ncbi:hypothetical protein Tco_1299465, partial [Tanacetum coccineum]
MQPSFLELDSGLVVLSFNQFDDLIASLNKAMTFLSTTFTSRFPQTNNQLRTSSNPRNQTTIQDGRVTVQTVQGIQTQGPKNSTWFKETMLLTEALESGAYLDPEQLAFLADNGDTVIPAQASQEIISLAAFQTDDLDAFDSDCDDVPLAKECYEQPSFDNDTEVDITSDSNIISYEQYLQETENLVVQSTSSYVQQDELLISVIEEMSSQVLKCNKVQQENLIVNETLTAELERYKEHVIVDRNAKVADFEKQIHLLKLQLNVTVESHKTLSTIVEYLKKASKQKEDKYLDEVINLQNKNKALDNVVYRMGQSTQTMHMLTKPQAFYDESHKTALGYQNPFYLSQARRKVPALYDGYTILKTHDALSVTDTEETLDLAEKNLVHTAVNSLAAINDYKTMQQSFMDEYNKTLVLKAELAKKHDMIEKDNVHNSNVVTSKVYKLDLKPLSPLVKHNRDAHIQELLVYVNATCLSLKPVNNKLVVVTPINMDRKVSGSKPRSNTKKDRILQTSSSNKKTNKVEDQPRIAKSSLNNTNRVSKTVYNANVKHFVLNANFELIYATCHECMFDTINDLCVSDYLNEVHARVNSKSVKSKSAKSIKKKMWKPTGKVYTNVGYSWKPTGQTFTIDGNTCPLTRIISAKVVPPRNSISKTPVKQTQPSSNKSGKLKDITNV